MSLRILCADELRGFIVSKIMIILLVGMPIMSLVVHWLAGPSEKSISIAYLTAILVTSISGTLGSVSLSTSITSEKNRHVYDLFIIRPVKRWEILSAKFLAVYACLILAAALSILVGAIVDRLMTTTITPDLVNKTYQAFGTCLTGTALAVAIGTFFGVVMNSVPAAAILSVYVGNQITGITSVLSIIPGLLPAAIQDYTYLVAMGVGGGLAVLFFLLAIMLFNKKQF
jgi:ABC-type transport system involved in multi-copper enzyme maturation permease subunit